MLTTDQYYWQLYRHAALWHSLIAVATSLSRLPQLPHAQEVKKKNYKNLILYNWLTGPKLWPTLQALQIPNYILEVHWTKPGPLRPHSLKGAAASVAVQRFGRMREELHNRWVVVRCTWHKHTSTKSKFRQNTANLVVRSKQPSFKNLVSLI